MDKIESEKYYSARALADMKVMPWGAMTLNKRLNEKKY